MENENQSAQPDLADIQAECSGLRKQIVNILVLLIVLSGTFNIYLLRRVKDVRWDLNNLKAQVTPAIEEYNRQSGPRIEEFKRKLVEYGRNHPEFVPILAKSGSRPQPGSVPSTSPPSATPPKK